MRAGACAVSTKPAFAWLAGTQWLHTIATDALTLYRVSAKRGDVPKELAGGVVVHDDFKSYGGLDGVAHALCNAHHLRELKALIAFDQESWAATMRELLLEANRAVEEARQRGQTALAPDLLTAFYARYFEALREGLAIIANCRPCRAMARTGARSNAGLAITCSLGCTSSKTTFCGS